MPAPARRLRELRPSSRTPLLPRSAGPGTPAAPTHPRPAPGRPGDAAPLRSFTTMKPPGPPLYAPPSSRPRSLPIGCPGGLRDPLRLLAAPLRDAAAHSPVELPVFWARPNQSAQRAPLSITAGRRPIRARGAPRRRPSAEYRGGPRVHSQHSSPAPLGLDSAPGAAGAAPTHRFVYRGSLPAAARGPAPGLGPGATRSQGSPVLRCIRVPRTPDPFWAV